jgi:hypothetical protein
VKPSAVNAKIVPKTSPNSSLKNGPRPRRQLAADVADLLAHLVPDLRHLCAGADVLQLDDDQRLARASSSCAST